MGFVAITWRASSGVDKAWSECCAVMVHFLYILHLNNLWSKPERISFLVEIR